MTAAEFLREYERRTNTHCFENVAPLIANNALFWFNDGSFQGKDAIKQAFENTWAYIQEEQYSIDNVQWLVNEANSAVCTYIFHWQGISDGRKVQGIGRGTSVLRKVDARWQVVHEHLSALPQ
jgi:ketosteroid isomerase-like protein